MVCARSSTSGGGDVAADFEVGERSGACALADLWRVLDDDHPDTLASRTTWSAFGFKPPQTENAHQRA